MKQRLTAGQSKSIVSSNARLCGAVGDALFAADVDRKHEAMCMECAARIFSEGFLDPELFTLSDPGGISTEAQLRDHQARLMFKKCETYGIIPSGLLAMAFWFIARQAAWYFIEKFIKSWWYSDKE
jgi:capsule polysaccharide modification protein KpsS